MPVVRYRGGAPASIAEGSRSTDWVANLALEGDLARLVAVETAGPMAAFFSASWNAALRVATIRPNAALDFESFSAAGALPQVDLGLSFVFDDGTRQVGGDSTLRIAVLDRDDTAPVALAFATGGTVAAGEIGAAIGRLSVTDPDTAGPFHFSFSAEDDWRFEVVNGLLKLRDGITLGLDDVPLRPILINVSDGRQSAAFVLNIEVTAPIAEPPPYTPPPLLTAGETRAGVSLAGSGEALTTRPAETASVVASQPGGVLQVVVEGGGEVWLGPLERLRFADGWLGPASDGPAAEAASLHRAVLGEDANGVDLAPLVASLRAGSAWTEIAEDLLDTAPALAALDNAAFVNALFAAAVGEGLPGAADLVLHTARLAGGTATRAQLVVDIALSPAALARVAEAAPAGHWVADPFDPASGTPARSSFDDSAPHTGHPAAGGWFM
jgi:hypothetical protein